MASRLPKLDILDVTTPISFTTPTKLINETSHVSHFLRSKAYRDICTFILQLNRSVCPRIAPGSPVPTRFPLSSKLQPSPSIAALQSLLSDIESLIAEAPPVPGPQRFGNVSFRTWHSLLEGKVAELLQTGLLNNTISSAVGSVAEVRAYLLGSFGSAQRIDYGTGHELSFIAFLGCLWKLGFFEANLVNGSIERKIVLQVIQPYVVLIRKLISTYNLEPAGTHGVWGLDDHSFAPYIFGSAQLTRPIHDDEPMPLEGSVRGAPKPGDITKEMVVEDERQTNMYFSAIGFINDIKKGPFWEHSPMLFDISGVKDGWGKINKGMIKMYNAEVLSKFPVVQHFPFGLLFSWDEDPEAPQRHQISESMQGATPTNTATYAAPSGTGSSWAPTARMHPPSSAGNAAGPSPSIRPSEGGNLGDGPTKAPWAK